MHPRQGLKRLYERHLNFIHLHREAPGNSVMFPDV